MRRRSYRWGLFFLLVAWLLSGCINEESTATPPPLTVPSLSTIVSHNTAVPASATPTPQTTPEITPAPTTRATATNTPTPSATPTPNYPVYDGPPIDRSEIGVQIHLHREDLDLIFDHLNTLNVGWVKVQVSWKLYQPEPARFDEARFEELDRLVAKTAENDMQLMLSVAKAPEWSRPTTDQDGPPSDYAHFTAFMALLAGRYQGQVAAYELWNEANLQREWMGVPLSAADLVRLIEAGAAGVRQVEPDVILISAAPSPTGINDGLTAVDDRQYFQEMVDAGVLDVVDVVGAHPYGWGNPPDATAANPDPVATSHNNHPSFFFLDTLRDYQRILETAGHPETEIWVTEFGWGSFDQLDGTPPAGVEFMNDVDEWQQAVYTLRAYEIAHANSWVGPMILWNLNFGPLLGPDFIETGFSILRPDGLPRPVYWSLTTINP